ncbi:MAG: PAS domain S-box protein [Pseudomonadota bacterium]
MQTNEDTGPHGCAVKHRPLGEPNEEPIFFSTLSGNLKKANWAFLDLFGLTAEESRSFDLRGLFLSPSDWDRVRGSIEDNGSVKDLDVGLKDMDGSLIRCLASGTLWLSEAGDILGYRGSFRDVTQRRSAEKRMRDRITFLETVIEAIGNPFYVIDADTYCVVMANAAARSFFGLGESTCHALNHRSGGPCETGRHPCPIDRIRKTGKPVRVEHTHYDQENVPCAMEVDAFPVFDDEGTLRYVIESSVDISERKKAEERRRLLITAVEQSPDIILITDAEGTIQYVNPAVEAVTGYSPADVIGSTPRMFKSGRQDKAVYSKMWGALERGLVWAGRLTNEKKDGSLYEEDTVISPVTDDSGRITNYVAVNRDVTKEITLRKQLVQAQKMESIGTLAGGLAHDFNNLLTIIQGFSELLLMNKQSGDPDYADLMKIAQAARNGADLVKRILTFSRKVETSFRPTDLNHEIKQIRKLLERMIPKMVAVEMLLSDDSLLINADPGQIEQVILNLAVNAKDAMPDGGKIVIRTDKVVLDPASCDILHGLQPGNHAVLTVTDTGHGMDRDVVDRIFEPFFTTKAVGKGTGLGLAMVYGIIKGHGGHITCHSRPGAGTSFKMYFPLLDSRRKVDPAATAIMPAFGTETLLLVDDEVYVRELAVKILSRAGYTVLTACNGKDAVEVYRNRRADISLVILDMIMPEMGGKQCFEELLKINPMVNVLISSGYSSGGTAKDALEMGARGFVPKPYKLKEMLQSIREVLDSKP